MAWFEKRDNNNRSQTHELRSIDDLRASNTKLWAQLRELRKRLHTLELEWDRAIARLNREAVRRSTQKGGE